MESPGWVTYRRTPPLIASADVAVIVSFVPRRGVAVDATTENAFISTFAACALVNVPSVALTTEVYVPTGSIEYKTIFAVGATLFLATLVMNIISIRLVRKYREVYE